MGWKEMLGGAKRGRHESLPLSELLEMKDKDIDKLIKSGTVPTEFTSAKVLRKAARQDKKLTERALNGEKSILPLVQGILGGQGSKNYQNIPLRDRVHPAEYKRILEREARKQGLL